MKGAGPSGEVIVPEAFFSRLLPHVDNVEELKALLYVLRAFSRKRTLPRLVASRELLGDREVAGGIGGGGNPPHEVLSRVLELALKGGVLLRTTVEGEELYFPNTGPDREAAARMESGEASPEASSDGSSIFALYEQNIGVLTPLIAEELKEAEALYPTRWIEDAFREAVSLNKRNWRYIARILERWSQEGRDYGAPGRDYQKVDPDKYTRGKYGHLVRR